jgi:hypothetical protein
MISPPWTKIRAASKVNEKLRVAVVMGGSALLLAALIVVASALCTGILGVPTSYGNGVDSRLGAQVISDFLADQEAEAAALSNGDQAPLGGRFTDSALSDLIQQITNQSASGAAPKVSFQPSSLTVLRAPDPADPTLTIEVQEEGTRTVVTSAGPNAAPTEQAISFHGDFWLRSPSGGRYAIADQHIQTLPISPLPKATVIAAALAVVVVATVLAVRRRGLLAIVEPTTAIRPVAAPALIAMPESEALPEAARPPLEMVVSTFGGLHVLQGGTDWAQALMSRPVTGFVWLRLLLSAISAPSTRVGRDEVARQASPGLSRSVQLKRLRNVVGKGLREMPAALRERILVEPEVMSFRLDGCGVDAFELLELGAELAQGAQLRGSQVTRVRRVLQACQGTFLPEFEAIEDLATDRHPTCTGLVSELRELLVNKRVDLSLLLADAHLQAGRPMQAIAVLEPALGDRSERKDLAARLAAAYRGAGRDAEAKALDARYA